MDGKELVYQLREIINEDVNSDFIDTKTSYTFLYRAARDFAAATNSLKGNQTITTIADQATYTLDAAYAGQYLKNDDGEFVIKYSDGTTTTFITWKSYESVIIDNQTNSLPTPSFYTIIDDPILDNQITGTTTSAGADNGGLVTLTDTGADFSDASPGDVVHNTSDGSDGYVVSKTSSTVLVCALFGGTDNDWTDSDAYVIQPQGRLQIILDPPPSTAGHTITVYYGQTPPPVFSDYGVYRFQQTYMDAIIMYAAWLYKYRDGQYDTGDSLFQYYERMLRRMNARMDSDLNKNQFDVRLRASYTNRRRNGR